MTTLSDLSAASRPPTLGDLRRGLAQVLGERFDGIWASVCREVGLAPDAVDMDDARLDQLLAAVARSDQLGRVIAVSWRIRRTAARKLASLGS